MRQRSVRSCALAVAVTALPLVAGCGKQNPVTANGTVLVEWDPSKATRVPFRAAKIGDRKKTDAVVTLTNGDAPVTLDVHYETAMVDYDEGQSHVHAMSPVLVSIKVKANDDWDMSAKCEEGPNYNMPGFDQDAGKFEAPTVTIQSCWVSYHRKGGRVFTSTWELGTSFVFEGDKLKLFPEQDGTIR